MGGPLGGDQQQREHGETNLEHLRAPLSCGEGPRTPLRRRPGAKRSYSPKYIEIEERTGNSDDHHGNSYRILVKSRCRAAKPGSRGERTETDDDANSADRHDGDAGALNQDKHEAR